LLTLDLPFDRRAEQNRFRESYIFLEQAVRAAQSLEDDIKLAVRNRFRNLVSFQESVRIQSQSVKLAERRIKSVNMFLDAGRTQIRDLLEAQEALLSAQNGRTSALVNYRVAELELQRDMGVLAVDETGLFVEYVP
jgi:outer membrane protein TolC